MKKIITTKNAPKAIGAYSQAVATDALLFLSGQVGLNPDTNALAEGIDAQTKQAMENISAILKEAGGDLSSIVKTTIFLNDLADFEIVNKIYSSYFTDSYPSRSCVEVSKLPKSALVEIEAIAAIKN